MCDFCFFVNASSVHKFFIALKLLLLSGMLQNYGSNILYYIYFPSLFEPKGTQDLKNTLSLQHAELLCM